MSQSSPSDRIEFTKLEVAIIGQLIRECLSNSPTMEWAYKDACESILKKTGFQL